MFTYVYIYLHILTYIYIYLHIYIYYHVSSTNSSQLVQPFPSTDPVSPTGAHFGAGALQLLGHSVADPLRRRDSAVGIGGRHVADLVVHHEGLDIFFWLVVVYSRWKLPLSILITILITISITGWWARGKTPS